MTFNDEVAAQFPRYPNGTYFPTSNNTRDNVTYLTDAVAELGSNYVRTHKPIPCGNVERTNSHTYWIHILPGEAYQPSVTAVNMLELQFDNPGQVALQQLFTCFELTYGCSCLDRLHTGPHLDGLLKIHGRNAVMNTNGKTTVQLPFLGTHSSDLLPPLPYHHAHLVLHLASSDVLSPSSDTKMRTTALRSNPCGISNIELWGQCYEVREPTPSWLGPPPWFGPPRFNLVSSQTQFVTHKIDFSRVDKLDSVNVRLNFFHSVTCMYLWNVPPHIERIVLELDGLTLVDCYRRDAYSDERMLAAIAAIRPILPADLMMEVLKEAFPDTLKHPLIFFLPFTTPICMNHVSQMLRLWGPAGRGVSTELGIAVVNLNQLVYASGMMFVSWAT